jgi:hypothetical protein
MEQISENLEKLKRSIADLFPAAMAAVIWGSSGNDFIPGVSDTDILIVGPRDDAVEKKLEKIHATGGDFEGQGIGRAYTFHKFDLYRIKTQGKVLLGDAKILNLFPDVSLDDALADTLPHIRNVFIPNLRKNLHGTDDAGQFLRENLNVILVIARTVYDIETKQFGSKLESLEYLRGRYPELADLFGRIRQIYLKQSLSDEQVPVRDIGSFFAAAENVIDEHQG